ncbi:anti-sigma factor family protein [Paraburkholderia lacunae]|uniref:Anti-sigma factor n=1 Tax=Paraburkholderia lacunae TaxID=2211104 RepID=A0A370ND23_9BURK|nr:anti-sigma factor [Paraburkholderia lacunae]RDK03510.1 anti-sigma factor [Paraburkholderia lacunae]
MNDDSDRRNQGSGESDLWLLSSLADNELSATERAATLDWLANDREAATRVADYRAQKTALAALFGDPREDVRCIVVRRRPPCWQQTGVAACCMVVGVVLGSAPGWMLAGFPVDQPVFAKRADIAYAVYAPDQRHPVEVAAAQEDHLVKWLSRRLDRPLLVPSLREYGYSLVGGRLLPDDSGPAAQFMYQNSAGARITLYVAAVPKNVAAFHLFRDDKRSTFYWVSEGMGCALTGHVSEAQLRAMAIDVCSALGGLVRGLAIGGDSNP